MGVQEQTASVDSVLAAPSRDRDNEGALTAAFATFTPCRHLPTIIFDAAGMNSITAGATIVWTGN